MYVEFPRPSGIRCTHNIAQNLQRRVGRWTWRSHSYENCFIRCAVAISTRWVFYITSYDSHFSRISARCSNFNNWIN